MTLPRLLIVLSLGLAGCARAPTPADATSPAPAKAARPVAVEVTAWALPVEHAASQPDLVRAPNGDLLLSWIEKGDAAHALRFARYTQGAWSTPGTIGEGSDWFVNWADTPHIQATADGALWAHWLRKSAAATYAYDVVLSRSTDGGAVWSTPTPVNTDGTPTEHGFVSLWAASRDSIGAAWLDGRNTGASPGGAHGGHGGPMSLRSAMFDAGRARKGEVELDASTCDCCQTDVAMTPRGALLAYRDRTADEIRDIAVTRLENGAWAPPRMVHADGWRMPGCPVNGPSIAAAGSRVVVGWYTEAGGVPMVRVAISDDAGDSFSAPMDLVRGPEVLGRVAVAWADSAPWITWLEEAAGVQTLWAARIDTSAAAAARASGGNAASSPGQSHPPVRVATLAGRGRGTGVPQLVASGSRLHVVWTDVEDGKPHLRGATIGAGVAR